MKNITISFGKRIRSLRQSKNISQEKLAELSSLHTTYIGQLERGEKSPTLDSIYKIAVGLNVDLCELFDKIDCDLSAENKDYASFAYNKIIGLCDDKKEKIYKIICEIIDFM